MNAALRLIKKYPNRRLYDTELSHYVTLEDVKKLVLQHIPFKVVDARTEEDLTNNTLLQIITELEQKGAPIFTSAMLQQLIRFYGNSYQNMFSDFLEKSMLLFKSQPSTNYFQDISSQQLQLWQNFQNQWQGFFKENQKT